ncbi:MAG: hypothetical protein JNK30_13330 [Phenylobacterium sp.]|uniref:hypothetical protein n=1 Tax=Phenylobacterium sp. TaxID=1871053 RepID=UPI001A3CB673|nr:hypothetical protein [Phenylobacterium sp.]MBL8772357.1 hypothetical protein [Phenylobacterium sp.]
MRIVALGLGLAIMGAGAVSVAVAAAPSPLPPPPPSGASLPKGQCVLTHELGNHVVVDQDTLLLDGFGRSKGVYRVTMKNGCLRSAVSSDPLAIRQVGGGRLCAPRDVEIRARSGFCAIDSIVKLSPDEVAALPRRLRP